MNNSDIDINNNSDGILEQIRSTYNLTGHRQSGLHGEPGCKEYLQCYEWMKGVCSTSEMNGYIEIGSAEGGSFELWGRNIQNGPKISVDWTTGDTKETSYCTMTPAQIKTRNYLWSTNFKDVHCLDCNSHLQETVDAITKILDGRFVSWLYIDAEHTYDAAEQDFNMYKHFVTAGGYIGFHDIIHPGVKEFWKEKIEPNYNCLYFGRNTDGLGVIQV